MEKRDVMAKRALMRDPDQSGEPIKEVRIRRRVNPTKSHHVARLAETPTDIEQAENEATLVKDGLLAFQWIAADPCRSMIGQEWADFGHSQGWTRGYRHAVAELVRDELVHRTRETAEQTRARIVNDAANIHQEARRSGEYGPALGALRLQADMLLPKEAEKTEVHLHAYVARLPPVTKTIEAWTEEAAKILSPPKDI